MVFAFCARLASFELETSFSSHDALSFQRERSGRRGAVCARVFWRAFRAILPALNTDAFVVVETFSALCALFGACALQAILVTEFALPVDLEHVCLLATGTSVRFRTSSTVAAALPTDAVVKVDSCIALNARLVRLESLAS